MILIRKKKYWIKIKSNFFYKNDVIQKNGWIKMWWLELNFKLSNKYIKLFENLFETSQSWKETK